MDKVYDDIRKIAKKYHIEKIILFGSRARGDGDPKSDIDIAAYFKDGFLEKESAAFRLEIAEDLPTLYELDVVCVDDKTDKSLLENIREDGVVLYMKEKKFDQYKKAVFKIKEASIIYAQSNDSLYRDGLIQRFEFTFELAWKTIKEYLESEGYSDVKTPKAVLKRAFSINIINSEKWNDMLDDRNIASHTYQEETAISISEKIQSNYVSLFEELLEKLESMAD